MKDVFELHDETNEVVVIKVNADDPLTVALHPYINSNIAYISVTKGKNHTLTTVLKDGRHGVNFHWGESGHTLISENLELLKKKVVKFIEDCDICLGLTHPINRAKVYYNSNFNSWQLTLNDGEGFVWEKDRSFNNSDEYSDDFEHGLNWGTEKLKNMLSRIDTDIKWNHKIAQTGIDVWEAVIA